MFDTSIFSNIIVSCDSIVSFFYNLMISTYGEFFDFITYVSSFTYNTLVFNNSIQVSLPDLGILNTIIGLFNTLFGKLFLPIPYFVELYGSHINVPFYLCFLSFFINSLIIVALFKLVTFLIELIPGE